MEVCHGGFQAAVAHIALDDPGVDTSFKEESRVAMAQGVNRDASFFDAGCKFCPSKGSLDTFNGHGCF
jgi:hypothetical protein